MVCPAAQGPNFVMLCSDTQAAHSIISIKKDEDKLVPIDSHKMFGIAGEAGDRVNFSEFIKANVQLYALRHSTHLNTKAVASFTRGELAKALRSVSAAADAHPATARARTYRLRACADSIRACLAVLPAVPVPYQPAHSWV